MARCGPRAHSRPASCSIAMVIPGANSHPVSGRDLSGAQAGEQAVQQMGAGRRQEPQGSLVTTVFGRSADNRGPLYHAAAAQRALELVVAQCQSDPACHAEFPSPLEDLDAVRKRLKATPIPVEIRDPRTGAPGTLKLTEPAFTDGVRTMLYSADKGRGVPLLLQRARGGELAPFAEAALASSLGFRMLPLGLLLSVTCSEDVIRIRSEEIAERTKGSFIGDHRVRGQVAACSEWPRAPLPAGYFNPRELDIPTLIVSGNLDPVTPPHWGEEVRQLLPNSVHLIFPAAHTAMNECLLGVRQRFFATGAVQDLPTACIDQGTLPPFLLREEAGEKV